jgi:hypothetical protein
LRRANLPICLLSGVPDLLSHFLQSSSRWQPAPQLAGDHLHGHPAGDFPRTTTTHPIGHQAEGEIREPMDGDGILIGRPIVALQAALTNLKRQVHRLASPSSPVARGWG